MASTLRKQAMMLTFLIFSAHGFLQPCLPSSRIAQRTWLSNGNDGTIPEVTPQENHQSMMLQRRHVLYAALSATVLTSFSSAATAAPMVAAPPKGVADALVWGGSASKAACNPSNTRSAFGPKFINYLTRFLLAYDVPSRRLWRARAAEIPLDWSEKQVEVARITQLGEFIGAAEAALCDFSPLDGTWSSPLTPNDAANIRRLLSLLRSRYGTRPDALRQLALLFSLLPQGVQPTSSIEQLAAEQEDREAAEVILIDRGSFVLSDVGLSEGLPSPALPLPAAPLARKASLAAVASPPRLQPTGRVIDMVVMYGGAGYDTARPPVVSITAPQSHSKGSRAAQAKAVIKDGTIVALELLDAGSGYVDSDRVVVVIMPPLGSSKPALGKVLLEYEIASVSLTTRGAGYGSSQDLDLRFFGAATNRSANFKTPTAAELAEFPWSLASMASKYGDQVASKSTSDVLVLRPPKGTLVLGKRGACARRDQSPTDPLSEPLLQRPPLPPAAPWDQQVGSIGRLLALLPPDEGAPIFDPGRPPSAKEPLGVSPRHRFPSIIFERINENYVDQAPLGIPFMGSKRGPLWGSAAADIAALPTSISGGVRQDVPLSPALVMRLTLAGGLCSAVTRGVTSPIDLRKTRAQAAAATATAPGQAFEENIAVSVGSTLASDPVESAAVSNTAVVEKSESNNWLGLDASVATGFALGAGSFGTFEFLKRSLPQLAASTLGPAAPAAFATPILLLACVLQAVVSSIFASPFETSRAMVMAGNGLAGAPTSLGAALLQVMTIPKEFAPEAAEKGENGSVSFDEVEMTVVSTEEAPILDVTRLWDGLPALMFRELPFGVTKLLSYAFIQDTLLTLVPAARERPIFALAVSLVSGILAGLVSAFVSHPADTVVTRLATGGFGRDWRSALDDVLQGAESEDNLSKGKVLFAGVGQRCFSLAIIVTAQFVLFDGLRTLLAVSKEDLSLVLDVFQDRVDFYSGWDEISGSWIDAVDNLDNDMVL